MISLSMQMPTYQYIRTGFASLSSLAYLGKKYVRYFFTHFIAKMNDVCYLYIYIWAMGSPSTIR